MSVWLVSRRVVDRLRVHRNRYGVEQIVFELEEPDPFGPNQQLAEGELAGNHLQFHQLMGSQFLVNQLCILNIFWDAGENVKGGFDGDQEYFLGAFRVALQADSGRFLVLVDRDFWDWTSYNSHQVRGRG